MSSTRDFSAAADAASRIASQLERSELQSASPHASAGPWRETPPRADYRGERLDLPRAPAPSPASGRQPSISPWLFVMATALNTMVAAVLAVIITLGVVRQERTVDNAPREMTLASAVSRPALAGDPTQQVVGTQAIELRPIGSPDAPLRLQAQRPAPLPLQLAPEEAAREPFILVLSGAPAGTSLTGAGRIGSDTWFIAPGAASRIEIVMPEWSTSVFEITMALRRINGQVAAQAKAWIAVPPPASPDAAGPKTAGKVDEAAAKDMQAKADRLIEKGDIVAARALYQRAAEMGSGSAALTLGATYDPNRLWSLGALGMVGNKERAKQWYTRASELGQPDARARLLALGN